MIFDLGAVIVDLPLFYFRLHYTPTSLYYFFFIRDEVVPFWHGQELFLATPTKWRAKPFWVDGAGHNNIEALLRWGTRVRC